ncbi:hypothetical protein [Halomontanus rarus]|uniref:hypothetical protein n=1 Tax=Halomontanus rarus TaxID=3034020 RepID=UPI0023E8705D|nr:hypothetical protein [Halovivax sp. TS33]
MSSNSNSNSDSNSNSSATGDVGREVAYRLFAAEYDDASLSHAESDEERAPNYVVTPTGARVNRLFAVGTLTEITPVNDEMLRARIVDPTGAFVVYAGQYQPEALAFLEGAEPPLFVAVTGKARTFQPEDSEQVYTSVRPESLAIVDAETRDRWVVTTAEQTRERIGAYAEAAGIDAGGDELADALLESGLEEGLARGIPLAQGHYGTTPDYLAGLRELSVDAVRVVAGERDEVGSFALAPDGTDGRGATFADLAGSGGLEVEADVDADESAIDAASSPNSDSDAASTPAANDDATAETTSAEPDKTEPTAATSGSTDEGEREPPEAESEPASESELSAASETEPATDDAGSETDDDLETVDSSDFDDDMYEMDEEERAEIEAEFGTEFTTGAEVDEPGEADIDVPESESGSDSDSDSEDDLESEEALEAESDTETTTESGGLGDFQTESDGLEDSSVESEGETETEAESVSETEASATESGAETDETTEETDESETEADAGSEEPPEDVDLQEYVVDTMRDLDDGSGADRAAIVETVAEETGADQADVEDAIEDALMGGQCYEPDDDTLKPI